MTSPKIPSLVREEGPGRDLEDASSDKRALNAQGGKFSRPAACSLAED